MTAARRTRSDCAGWCVEVFDAFDLRRHFRRVERGRRRQADLAAGGQRPRFPRPGQWKRRGGATPATRDRRERSGEDHVGAVVFRAGNYLVGDRAAEQHSRGHIGRELGSAYRRENPGVGANASISDFRSGNKYPNTAAAAAATTACSDGYEGEDGVSISGHHCGIELRRPRPLVDIFGGPRSDGRIVHGNRNERHRASSRRSAEIVACDLLLCELNPAVRRRPGIPEADGIDGGSPRRLASIFRSSASSRVSEADGGGGRRYEATSEITQVGHDAGSGAGCALPFAMASVKSNAMRCTRVIRPSPCLVSRIRPDERSNCSDGPYAGHEDNQ